MIKDGSKVTLHYTLKVEGQVVDSSQGGNPLSYVHGKGQIVPGLEERLEGLNTGDQTTAVVPPEKGYGARNPEALQQVPRSAFQSPDDLSVGDTVTGQAGGHPIQATIAAVGSEGITLDLNHPLAGKTLHFEVEIVKVA